MNVYAIIVCYRPVVDSLVELCRCLSQDGVKVVLVDNTEQPYLKKTSDLLIHKLITLGCNAGIAKAQNIGIKNTSRADVIVFFDQDSKIYPGFVDDLLLPIDISSAEVVSPLCKDEISDFELPALKLNHLGFPMPVNSMGRMEPYPVDIVISSGTAATIHVFEHVGLFNEEMFIDSVDTEWCLRCRSLKIPIRIIPTAVMRHRIGGRTIAIKSLKIFVHSPTRCYYQLRNSMMLLSMSHVPKVFALKELVSFIFNRTLMLIFVESRFSYIRAIFQGGFDGLKYLCNKKKNKNDFC